MARRRVLGVLGVAIVVLLAIVAAWVWFHVSLTARRTLAQPTVAVTIEPGMGTREIVARLGSSGVVPNQTALLLWLSLTNQGRSLKAGDYEFESPISAVRPSELRRATETAARTDSLQGPPMIRPAAVST